MTIASYNVVEIKLSALRENYRRIRERVGQQVPVMAMVKADAYGHGLLPVARTLYDAGVRTFGVAEAEEGIALRLAGIEGAIFLLLGMTPEMAAEVIRHRLTPVIFDHESLAALAAEAVKMGARVGVHVKVDIGMGRLGIMPEDLADFFADMSELPGVFPAGILAHFPMADDSDTALTMAQCQRFKEILADDDLPISGLTAHIANSAALIRHSRTFFSMVRPGIALYGCYPAPDPEDRRRLPLAPVMSFKTRVIQVKEIPVGFGVSYGHKYITDRPTRLAVLPVGYADGYLRKLTGRAEVLIRGQRAPVRGTICMNLCMADVTSIAGVRAGDEVVLMGRQDAPDGKASAEISADEIAGWMDSINYEVLCLFGNRNRRVYL